VLVFYFLVGGRVYCSWVCPVNPVTDFAAWLRGRLGLTRTVRIDRGVRYWVLGATLALAAATGTIAWELVNPVSMLHRGLVFGIGAAWIVVLAVFLFDLLFSHRGWCGHLCPVGAFYSVLALKSPVRVTAARREHCNDCLDCYAVCPELQVIKPALKGADRGLGPVILSPNCTNCGRCIDVCSKRVFRFGLRQEDER
jgi:ferredoxin-type protein NapH